MQNQTESDGVKWKTAGRMGKHIVRSLKTFDAKRIIRKLRSDALHNPQEGLPGPPDEETGGERVRVTWDDVISTSGPATHTQDARGASWATAKGRLEQRRASHPASHQGHADEIKVPDWFLELSDDHLEVFQKIFWLLDVDHGGFIDVDELHDGLKRVDSQVTREEVEATLKMADKTGTGVITFEEFLFMMSQIDRDNGKKQKDMKNGYTKRQCLFYSAIARFTAEDIKPPVYSIPHVIKHYNAGARLIGLTCRQLDENLRQLTQTIEQCYRDSPYAKMPCMPKEYPPPEERCIPVRRKPRSRSLSPKKTLVLPDGGAMGGQASAKRGSFSVDQTTWSDGVDQPRTNEERAKWFKSMISKGYNRSSIVAMLPGLDKNLLAELDKESSENESKEEIPSNPTMTEQPSSTCKPAPSSPVSRPANRKYITIPKKRTRGWRTPKVAKQTVEPPVLCMKYKESEPTMDDMPRVRKKAKEALTDYYNRIRVAAVEAARKHWEKLFDEGMRSVKSAKQQARFHKVYSTYSPFQTDKVVIASQWIPGVQLPKPAGPNQRPFEFYV